MKAPSRCALWPGDTCAFLHERSNAVMKHEITFAKLHGLGNDFIVVPLHAFSGSLNNLARQICDRHTGVGADGLAALLEPKSRRHQSRIRIFNSDGSEAEMSGNGIRCVGGYLAATDPARKKFEIETLAGLKTLEMTERQDGQWAFRVRMGAPILAPAKIPFKGKGVRAPVVSYPLRTRRGVLPVTVTSMGNPHCSIFVSDFVGFDWETLGQEIERHHLFPHRTNVEFVKLISRNEVEVRFWERGAGHTMSSGTGSSAAVVAGVLNGLIDRKVTVRTLAGSMKVYWPKNGEVILTGPVVHIAQGKYSYHD